MKLSKPILTVALCLLSFAPALLAQTPRVWYGKYRVHQTRLIARFTDGVSTTLQQSTTAQLNEKVTRAYSLVPGLVVLEPDAPTLSALTTPAPSKNATPDIRERIRALMATGAFKYVQPDYELTTSLTPNDTRFTDGTLWGLKNTGQSGGVAGAHINAEAAWNITTGSANVIVAVIDSGIRYTHQDLAAQMWINSGEIAGNGLDDDNDGFIDNVHGINAITDSGDPMDDNDHGTHCAGTIGAAANDGNPHVGVAWEVQLMACKFLDANGSGNTSDAIECINFASANGARVLNNSWGGGPFQQALFDAIVGARDQGVLFVAAAGNGGNDGISDDNDITPSFPASYSVDNVIAVAAVDRADQLASFSNFGQNSVHLGAPGVAIFSSTSGADNEYKTFNGTSMATPHVSGVAALVLAQSPSITYVELRQRLLQGVVPIAALNGKTETGGRLNAFNSLSTASGDGILEISVNSPGGTTVSAGSIVSVFVKVTDLTNINNATVVGSIPAQANTSFLNNGVAPDVATGDGVYSANIQVPAAGSSFTLTLVASAAGKVSATNAVVFSIVQSAPNDTFASAIVIPPAGGTVNGTNVNATSQSSEPTHCDVGGGKSVWWRWTAPQNQITTITTLGSDFDTVLAVYTGNSVSALTSVTCNDEVPGGFSTSEVIFQAVAGTTYRIAVDGFAGEEGKIALTLTGTPPVMNDDFADRTPITGINRSFHASNFGATVEGPEPFHCGNGGGASVWWSWTAPSNVAVSVSTAGSTYDTILAVYTGSNLSTLAPVDCNDDRIPEAFPSVVTSEVSFNAVNGVTYQIAVKGFETDQGNITLSLVTTPANNQFANRIPLNGAFAETTGSNIRATRQSGEPNHGFAGGQQSVWWTWTAPASGNASITTWGSSYDTALGVYTGNSVNALTFVAGNDDEAFPIIRTSTVTFAATAGTAYQIAVDGFLYTDEFDVPVGTDVGLIALTLSLDGKSRLDDFQLRSDGHYEFTLKGDSGRRYLIEAASSLSASWSFIGEVFLNGPSAIFIDPVAASNTNRFYRAKLAPLTQ